MEGTAIFSPSTALRTEIAGVIMASPKNKDAPARPTTSRIGCNRPATGSASDRSAMVPPSPWLSARMTKTTYLTVTMRMIAQNTIDSTPKTVASAEASPAARSDSRNA